MRKGIALGVTLVFLLGSALAAQDPGAAYPGATRWQAGLLAGYKGGFGIRATGTVSGFTPSFPVSARLGISYVSVDAGHPLDARRVFINDATNGVPQEKGHYWDFSFDLLYPISLGSLERAQLYGGLRHARFTGNFRFIGGNEDFDINSNHWGFGSGLETYIGVTRSVDIVVSGGFDYYFSSRMTGHDTSYSPDGDDVNPRQGYSYDDADEAVGQPGFELQLMVGFDYHFQ
jgi:hypothetical protein